MGTVQTFEHSAVKIRNWEEFLDRSGIRESCLNKDIRRKVELDDGFVRPAGSILVWQSDRLMPTAGVVEALQENGLQPEDLWSQFVLAVTKFRLRAGEPVVALGRNHVHLGNNAPTLFVLGERKNLQLNSLSSDWYGGCRFVVRPISA
jgi:hypothetical protein